MNLLLTKGTGDSLHFGPSMYFLFTAIIAGIIGSQYFIVKKQQNKVLIPLNKKTVVTVATVLSLIVLSDKAIYAVSDLYNNKSVLRHVSVLPLYQPLTIKRAMRKHFNFKVAPTANIQFKQSFSSINYPLEEVLVTPDGSKARPNIIVIMLDAWRYDMLSENLTPNIHHFSKEAIVFKNHFSGGNCTRFGVFSLFYGINSYYWHQFLSERQSPVLIDTLQKIGYDFKIITSANCNNPEFRSTAFVTIPEAISDDHDGTNAETKDPEVTRKFLEWIQSREQQKETKPFFSFLFFDAPHGPYSYPDNFDHYKPSNRSPNYMTVGKKDAVALKNSYQNAIKFNDHLTGQIIKSLKDTKLIDNTIVIITADHGEEFYESGFIGHNSAFTTEQTKVPFIMYVPDRNPEEITYMTSHMDVVPTILDLFEITTPHEKYSQGSNLLNGKGHDYAVISSWDTCSVRTTDHIIVFSLKSYKGNYFEILNTDYSLAENESDLQKKYVEPLVSVMKGLNLYLN